MPSPLTEKGKRITIAPLGSNLGDSIITYACFFSFWWKVPKGYMALELFSVSARTIKRHHHQGTAVINTHTTKIVEGTFLQAHRERPARRFLADT
jgi:hypothetical protein